jgi:hypothetical protein
MLRKTLLVTTALVMSASVAYANHKSVVASRTESHLAKFLSVGKVGHMVHGQPVTALTSNRGDRPIHNNTPHLEAAKFSNWGKAANAQYVSWYGYTAVAASSCFSGSSYFECFKEQANNALAFTSGVTASTKTAEIALFSFYPSAQYQVDLYSSSGGLPGAVLGHSKSTSDSDTSLCCTAARTVKMTTPLTAGTPYFLGVVCASNPCDGGWNMENTDFSGASVDYFHFNESGSYSFSGSGVHTFHFSSPWHASTYLPTTGAIVLK